MNASKKVIGLAGIVLALAGLTACGNSNRQDLEVADIPEVVVPSTAAPSTAPITDSVTEEPAVPLVADPGELKEVNLTVPVGEVVVLPLWGKDTVAEVQFVAGSKTVAVNDVPAGATINGTVKDGDMLLTGLKEGTARAVVTKVVDGKPTDAGIDLTVEVVK